MAALADLQKSERVRASSEARDWTETLKATKEALAQVGLEDQPAAFSQSAAETIAQLPTLGLLKCEFFHRFLESSKQTIRQAAISRLQAELQRRIDLAEACKSEFEAADSHKAMSVTAALAHKRRVADEINEQRAILSDKGDSIQQGCACGLIIACIVLGGYLAVNFVLAFTGRQTHIAAPLNVLFLTLFVLPVSVTLMAQIIHGMKRFMVESDFKTKMHQASILCDKAIEQAEDRYRNVEPALKRQLAEAQSEVDKVKAALKTLGIETKPTATEPSPSDNV